MPSPSFRSLTEVAYGAHDTFTLSAPSGLADDDILVAVLQRESTEDVTAPAGFTLKDSHTAVSGGGYDARVYWKRAAAESGDYEFTWTTPADSQAILVAISGCATEGDPFDVFDTDVRDNGSAATTPTGNLTTTVVDTLLMWVSVNQFGGPWSTPTDFTEHFDNGGSGVIQFCTLAQAAAAPTGDISTASGAGNNPCGFFFGALIPFSEPEPEVPTTHPPSITSHDGVKVWTPSILGLDDVDLTAEGPFTSRLLALHRYRDFHVNGFITEAGTTTEGEISLALLRYADEDAAILLDTIPLLTSVLTTTTGTFSITFGRDFAAAENGRGTLGVLLGLLRVIPYAKFKVTVVTPADGTTCLLNVYLTAS